MEKSNIPRLIQINPLSESLGNTVPLNTGTPMGIDDMSVYNDQERKEIADLEVFVKEKTQEILEAGAKETPKELETLKISEFYNAQTGKMEKLSSDLYYNKTLDSFVKHRTSSEVVNNKDLEEYFADEPDMSIDEINKFEDDLKLIRFFDKNPHVAHPPGVTFRHPITDELMMYLENGELIQVGPAPVIPPVEVQAPAPVIPPVEVQAQAPVIPPVETEAQIIPPVEVQAQALVIPPVEVQAPAPVIPPVEVQAPAPVIPPVEAPVAVEDEIIIGDFPLEQKNVFVSVFNGISGYVKEHPYIAGAIFVGAVLAVSGGIYYLYKKDNSLSLQNSNNNDKELPKDSSKEGVIDNNINTRSDDLAIENPLLKETLPSSVDELSNEQDLSQITSDFLISESFEQYWSFIFL